MFRLAYIAAYPNLYPEIPRVAGNKPVLHGNIYANVPDINAEHHGHCLIRP